MLYSCVFKIFTLPPSVFDIRWLISKFCHWMALLLIALHPSLPLECIISYLHRLILLSTFRRLFLLFYTCYNIPGLLISTHIKTNLIVQAKKFSVQWYDKFYLIPKLLFSLCSNSLNFACKRNLLSNSPIFFYI